jgi:hypothetical protein
MFTMNKYVLLLITVLSVTVAKAQTLIKAGDRQICYSLIKPQRNLYKYVMMDSTGKKVMEAVSEEIISIDSAHQQLIRTQINSFGNGRTLTDSTIADLHTLRPVRMRMVTSPSVMSMNLDFRPTQVKAIANRNGVHTDTVHRMEEGYFDSNLIEYLFRLLPYADGFQALVNAYTFERSGMDPHTIRYLGEDLAEDASGNIRKMNLVEVTSTDGKAFSLFWFDKDTGKMYKHVGRFGNRRFLATAL